MIAAAALCCLLAQLAPSPSPAASVEALLATGRKLIEEGRPTAAVGSLRATESTDPRVQRL